MLLSLDGEGPIYQQVYRALRDEILAGRLEPGAPIPSTRALARENAISRNRMLLAVEQLELEGYLEGRERLGTFVSTSLPVPKRAEGRGLRPAKQSRRPRLSKYAGRLIDDVEDWTLLRSSQRNRDKEKLRYDFRYGRLHGDDVPTALFGRELARATQNAPLDSLDYGDPAGLPEIRSAIAEYLIRVRGVRAEPDRIIVTSGSHQGLALVARVLINDGDRVAIEEAHYPGARAIFQSEGARLEAVPVDREGMKVGSIPTGDVRLAYVTPSHQYPLGPVMSASRRLELLRWAEKRHSYILEDDYDSEFRYEGRPVQSLQGIDSGGFVVYVGGFSKLVFPGLRLGYIVAPENLLPALRAAKSAADSGSSAVSQLAVAAFMRAGRFDRQLRELRAKNSVRHATLLDAIGRHLGTRASVEGSRAGLHVVLWLGDHSSAQADALATKAAEKGVGIYPVSPFFLRPPRRAGFLLGFSGLDDKSIRAGIRRLAGALD